MTERRIEPTDGCEVYVSEAGHICIKQISMTNEEAVIALNPSDIPRLVKFLTDTHQEFMEQQEAEQEERQA